MEPAALLPLITPLLSTGEVVATPDTAVATALAAAGWEVRIEEPAALADDSVGAILLLAGEVPAKGDRGPTLLADAVRATRPGGIIAVAAPSAVPAELAGVGDGQPALAAAAADHLLRERGIDVELLAAPGAAARLAGRPWAGLEDLPVDRTPGLLEAGEVVLAVGRSPGSMADRSRTFFGSIARKITAASVICTDEAGRVLVVFDDFRRMWTLPGGLVDAAESPADAAVREAWEEGGVRVVLDELLGVFAHDHPDRVQFFYAARPAAPTPDPSPVHTHEVTEVRWVTRARAEAMVDPMMRRRMQECLDGRARNPVRTWGW